MNTIEHLLTVLAEECCEVGQNCSKALRFGLDDKHPKNGNLGNRALLDNEVNDLLGAIELCREAGILPRRSSPARIGLKQAKVRRYMEYARKVGTLKDT
jgi:hypothetical protein